MNNETDRDAAAEWMRAFAASPVDCSTSLDPQILWWKAQALRRIDKERQALSAFDVVERIQIACVVAAALALTVWLMRAPAFWSTVSIALVVGLCGVIVAAAVGLTAWDTKWDAKWDINWGAKKTQLMSHGGSDDASRE